MRKILVLGAGGQIGTDLVATLRQQHGPENVIASDLKSPETVTGQGPYEKLDATDAAALREVVQRYEVGTIYHLVAMLSATAEKVPEKGWQLNMNTLFHVLNLAREGWIEKVFWPSSIAAFGPTTPKQNTPQFTVMDPGTVYGISKLSGELWCQYYHQQYGVDVRSIRYPGLISYAGAPGGGTTDYAIDIFHKALAGEPFQSFLGENRALPMMYMPDAIRATITLMEAPAEQVKIRTSYNVTALSFTPPELGAAIQSEIPGFTYTCTPDERDTIAAGWPQAIDDSRAREDWGWQPEYDLAAMVKDMLHNLRQKKGS
ncbi:MAG: NAD-dependent epimerase/dehydratase family protein [Schleiferiaceae bacterium]|nr:NAD-dependent epimerase/dehydratase family protein [Schleiferiaceae bacterium]